MEKKTSSTLSLNRLGFYIPATFCAFLWGGAFTITKIGFQLWHIGDTDVFTKMLFAGIRFTLAGLSVLAIHAFGRHRIVPSHRAMPEILTLSLTQTGFQYALNYTALGFMAASKATILTTTSVFFTILFSHFMFKNDRITLPKVAGCVVGFAGVVIISLSGSGDYAGFSLWGEGLVLVAALLSGISSPLTKRITQKGCHPAVATGWQLSIGGLLLLAAGLAGGGRLSVITPMGLLVLAWLIFVSAAAFTINSSLIQRYSASRAASFILLQPVFGVICGSLLLGEQVLSLRNILALGLVATGIALASRPAKVAPSPAG